MPRSRQISLADRTRTRVSSSAPRRERAANCCNSISDRLETGSGAFWGASWAISALLGAVGLESASTGRSRGNWRPWGALCPEAWPEGAGFALGLGGGHLNSSGAGAVSGTVAADASRMAAACAQPSASLLSGSSGFSQMRASSLERAFSQRSCRHPQ